jgi:hypothetical protein
MKVIISEWETPIWPPSIQMGVTAGIFLASILLKEMRYLVYIRYLWFDSRCGLNTHVKRVSQRSAESRGFSPGAPVSSHRERVG